MTRLHWTGVWSDDWRALRWRPIDDGKPLRCSYCDAPLYNRQCRAPHIIQAGQCVYFCDPCTELWLGPFQ